MQVANKYPIEIWSEILSYLCNDYDLLIVSMVNKESKVLLMDNKFWCHWIDNNYKYAHFNVYNSILDFANIHYKMHMFLDNPNDTISTCVLSTFEPVICKKITTDLIFLHNFPHYLHQCNTQNIYIKSEQHNDYCGVVDARDEHTLNNHNEICHGATLLIYSKFLQNTEWITLSNCCLDDVCTCKWNFIIYGNYVLYVIETLYEGYLTFEFFAKNILTSMEYRLYEYEEECDELHDKVGSYGTWNFAHTSAGLVIQKNDKCDP